MRSLRHKRQWIGSMLAAIFLLTAVMPGLLAAAQGVEIQGHICSPDSASSEPVGEQPFFAGYEHCQLCPAGFINVPFLVETTDDRHAYSTLQRPTFFADYVAHSVRRIELTPLNGRAPPYRS
tara:strand:- start:434 stop:799 length:366 start_codon:yes stop_codon:yes gene_type:complete